jgi:hypothetical protein
MNKIIEKNKYLYLFGFFGFLLIVSAILRVLTPDITTAENTWQEITPGKNSIIDVEKKLGSPIGVTQYSEYSVLQYDSPFPTMPHEVAIDKNNLVIFIKEYLTYDENHKIDQYLDQYQETDLDLYAPMISEAVKAHVFLEEGLVIIAHMQNGAVEQKWYFIPTDKEVFIKSWEKELTQIQKGPDRLITR